MTQSYPDLTIPPQLVRNARLLTVFLEADPALVGVLLPSTLSLRSASRIVLNMWSHSDPNETSGFGGFGPMSISYFAVEVAGEEGRSSDGANSFPGRYWLHHWSNFGQARTYAQAASGLEILPGETVVEIDGDRIAARLFIDGLLAISASAYVGHEKLGTASGHSVYYARRIAAAGGFEVAKFVVPWVSDAFDAHSADVELSFSNDDLQASLFGGNRPVIAGVSLRNITLVPYLAVDRFSV